MIRNLLVPLLVLYSLTHYVKGYNQFEGMLPGAFCFQPREVAGCSGTLIDSYQPESKGVGINQPDTLVFLFTPANPIDPEYLHDCGGKLPSNTNFNPSWKTEVFVHGWFDGTCRTAWMREMRDQLFKRGNYNVMFIDWTWGNAPDYYDAAANTRVVGEQLAFVLKNIMDETGVDASSFHITGHSFGSHIAGFAGQIVENLGRITALDPALAPFKYAAPEDRLDPSDAQVVDAIHSNAGDCGIATNFGYKDPIGHADFYPNGGSIQESCLPYIFISFLKLDFLYGFFTTMYQFCYHLQVLQFYKVSINNCDCQFIAVECPDYESFKSGNCSCGEDGSNCAIMGMDFEPRKEDGYPHTYYLDTELTCPYCQKSSIDLQGFSPESDERKKYCNNVKPVIKPPNPRVLIG